MRLDARATFGARAAPPPSLGADDHQGAAEAMLSVASAPDFQLANSPALLAAAHTKPFKSLPLMAVAGDDENQKVAAAQTSAAWRRWWRRGGVVLNSDTPAPVNG